MCFYMDVPSLLLASKVIRLAKMYNIAQRYDMFGLSRTFILDIISNKTLFLEYNSTNVCFYAVM